MDSVDSGGHLTYQRLLVNGYGVRPGQPGLRDLWLLTDLVGGAWLRLWGAPQLLWARIGGVLTLSLCAAIAYSTLIAWFPSRSVFTAVIVSTMLVVMRSPRFLIEYYTFPALLLTVVLLLLSRLMVAERVTTIRATSVLLGAVLVAVVLSRFVLIPVLVTPILIAIYLWRSGHGALLRQSTVWALGGVAVAAVCFLVLFAALGYLVPYVSAVSSQLIGALASGADVGRYHSADVVLAQDVREYAHVAKLMVAAGVAMLAIGWVAQRWGSRVAIASMVLLTAVASISQIATAGIEYYALSLIDLSIGFVLVSTAVFLVLDRGATPRLGVLSIASVMVMLVNPVGSADGIYKSIHGMWVALPLAILLTERIEASIPPRARLLHAILRVRPAAVVMFAVICGAMQYSNVFRDAERSRLVARFISPGLRFIHSTPERVAEWDPTISEIRRQTLPSDTILVVGEDAMMYWLTATEPLLREPWIELEPLAHIQELVADAEEEGRLPELLVVDTTSLHGESFNDAETKDRWLITHYVDDLGFQPVWETGVFRVYTPPERPAPSFGDR